MPENREIKGNNDLFFFLPFLKKCVFDIGQKHYNSLFDSERIYFEEVLFGLKGKLNFSSEESINGSESVANFSRIGSRFHSDRNSVGYECVIEVKRITIIPFYSLRRLRE